MKTCIATVTALLLCVPAAQASTAILAPVDRGIEYIYPEPNDYQLAVVTVDFEGVNDNFRASLSATGLKPGFAYQVKLEGIPACAGGNDETNERIGYAGRWSCLDCEASPAGNNRSDAQYEANKLLPDGDPNKECIAGYLVFAYFVADQDGNADVWAETDASYRVLWCGPTSGSNASLYSGYTPPGSYCEDGKYCMYQDITPQIERATFRRLPDGEYTNVRFVLTEESFHQNCGTWCSVLAGEILFEIASEPSSSWGEAALAEASVLPGVRREESGIVNRLATLLFPMGVILFMKWGQVLTINFRKVTCRLASRSEPGLKLIVKT